MSKSEEPVPESKWIKGVSGKQPLCKAAHRILRSRLCAVSYWLPLAAEKSEEDAEYVHQLRVSTRRAAEALRVFSDLIPEPTNEELRARLHQLRQAADEARNLDVLCAEFVGCSETSCGETCARIAEAIRRRRRDAQGPIVAIHEQFAAESLGNQIADILERIEKKGKRKSQPSFGEQAPRYLRPVLKKFFRASEADLTDDEAFHGFRLRGKKLRYTMESVAPAFDRAFQKQIYRRISVLLDVMGKVNDHATAKSFFGDWIEKTDDPQLKAFLRGILFAEMKAHDDLRRTFDAIWTPEAAKELRRQFRAYCRASR